MNRFLIVDTNREDALPVGRRLEVELQRECVLVDSVETVASSLLADVDVVLLWERHPGPDAVLAATSLRARSFRGGITIVAEGASPTRITDALRGPADDFVLAPIDHDELAARLGALVRRCTGHIVRRGDMTIDTAGGRLFIGGSEVARLTGNDLAILRCLAETEGRIVPGDELEDRVRPRESARPCKSRLGVALLRLRERLGPHASRIETIPGHGYRLFTRRSR